MEKSRILRLLLPKFVTREKICRTLQELSRILLKHSGWNEKNLDEWESWNWWFGGGSFTDGSYG